MSNGLGRIHAPDERDANYPLRSLIPETITAESKVWRVGRNMPLDQGDTPRCEGFAWAGWLYSAPIQRIKHDPGPDKIYELAQSLDGMPLPHDGTTTRAAVQGLQQLGHVESYHWAQSVDDIRDYVLSVGPLVFGVDWLTSMDSPDARGVVTVGGSVRGGHAFLCRGFHGPARLFEFEQSWGPSFGLRGRFFIDIAGVSELVFARGTGEACAAVERAA